MLGTILATPEAIFRVSKLLKSDMFAVKAHRLVYTEIAKLHAMDHQINRIAVAHNLGENTTGKPTAALLSAMEHAAVSADYVPMEEFVEMMADGYQRDEAKKLFQESIGKADDMGEPIIQTLESAVAGSEMIMGRSIGDRPTSLTEALNLQMDVMAAAYQEGKIGGYDTGLTFINSLTGSWCRGQYIIIGASTKSGKSSLAMQCATGLAEFGPVLYFSFEMNAKLLAAREIARRSAISSMKQRRGDFDEEDFLRAVKAAEALAGISDNLFIEGRKVSATQIKERCRRFKKERGGLLAVFVDHLGIMAPEARSRSASDWEIASLGSPIMPEIAEEHDCIAVGLSQVLKENVNKEYKRFSDRVKACMRKPTSYDLKGAISNDADHVLQIHRPEAELAKIEPAEGTDDWHAWDQELSLHRGIATVHLTLSREASWPAREEVLFDNHTATFRAKEIGDYNETRGMYFPEDDENPAPKKSKTQSDLGF